MDHPVVQGEDRGTLCPMVTVMSLASFFSLSRISHALPFSQQPLPLTSYFSQTPFEYAAGGEEMIVSASKHASQKQSSCLTEVS